MARLAPYSARAVLAKPDGRTREGRLLRDTRADLVAHVGGTPSATQKALIERAVALTLQIALMDTKLATAGFTDHDHRAYIAWTNALTRLMRQLGLKGAAERVPTLRDYQAARVTAA